jgi:hypothetical protein
MPNSEPACKSVINLTAYRHYSFAEAFLQTSSSK